MGAFGTAGLHRGAYRAVDPLRMRIREVRDIRPGHLDVTSKPPGTIEWE